MKKKELSIIIVNYKVKERVIDCINSIIKNTNNLEYEIIVVDNSSDSKLEKEVSVYKDVSYIDSKINLGFGRANNLGSRLSTGDYLFFLNPDTLITKDSINKLFDFIKKNLTAGIISPILVDSHKKIILKQGFKLLTPVTSIFTYSFLNKFFYSRSIFTNFGNAYWKSNHVKEVDTIFGASMMLSKKNFLKVNGFDERMFLYFEENDISKKIQDLGLKNYIVSDSKIIHLTGQSTENYEKRDREFIRSRYYYLKKHFGLPKAILAECLNRLSMSAMLITGILVIALLLRIINLENGMQFIGDQGWFYLSARDLIVDNKIPLVGITSSHAWLNQGPLWTYILAVFLRIFNFNPVSGAYATVLFGLGTVFLIYKVGRDVFSRRIGIIASLLYATSPLIIRSDRVSFDPSLIPFFTVIYSYFIYRWVSGNKNFFPLILLFLAILYNLELATFSLVLPVITILIYGFLKKKNFVFNIFDKKIILKSIILTIIPMMPVIIYDFSHGFKQTIVFLGWIIYKPFSFLIRGNTGYLADYQALFTFLGNFIKDIVFGQNFYIALLLFILSLIFVIYKTYKGRKHFIKVLFLLNLFTFIGVLINKTPSDAYLPIIFPFVILNLALFMDKLINFSKINILILLIILIFNSIYSLNQSLSNNDIGKRLRAVDKIIFLTREKNYNLIGKGYGSQFESFTMNYEYLLWWKGHPISKSLQSTKIVVEEKNGEILITKNSYN